MDRRKFVWVLGAAPLCVHPFFAHAQAKTMKGIQAMQNNWKTYPVAEF